MFFMFFIFMKNNRKKLSRFLSNLSIPFRTSISCIKSQTQFSQSLFFPFWTISIISNCRITKMIQTILHYIIIIIFIIIKYNTKILHNILHYIIMSKLFYTFQFLFSVEIIIKKIAIKCSKAE